MKRRRRSRPLPLLPAWQRLETGPDGYRYKVRPVAGARAVKTYRCPGCDHEIRFGTPHVVVWRAEDTVAGLAGLDDRRHWHTACWAHRDSRGPTRERS